MAHRKFALLGLAALFLSHAAIAETPVVVPGLESAATVLRDDDGIPHIIAENELDLVRVQGWVHARDRLFQMDVSRRQASGTLAELFGPGALESDVEFRTLGMRRAAEQALPGFSPEVIDALTAYAEGVNAYVAAHPLPPEYEALELTVFEPWDPVDTLAVGKLLSLSLSFDLEDIFRTEALVSYQKAGALLDFDGNALFLEDLFRSAPFDPAATVPDATRPLAAVARAEAVAPPWKPDTGFLRPEAVEMARGYLARMRQLRYGREALRISTEAGGSNEWAVSGALTESGRPMIANDPHLPLGTPATFYQNHLLAPLAGFDVIGSSLPGAPYVVLGQNRHIAWGATFHNLDVIDVFQEKVVFDPELSTVHSGEEEPVETIPVTFYANVIGDSVPDNLVEVPAGGGIPDAVLIVPRRNHGPIVELDPSAGVALSIAYTGFSPTRELAAFRAFSMARGLDDFIAGLQSFDVGSQNWAYVDTRGNIAYFTSAEAPLREDLQAGREDRPPFLIRDGEGGYDWIPVDARPPHQAVPFEILPFEEMPQVINPPAGYFVNANNDPAGITLDNDPLSQRRPGGGMSIYYLSPGYDTGIRAARIKQLLEKRMDAGPITADHMKAIQADTVLFDAEVFTPLILGAFESAIIEGAPDKLSALAADPRVAEAVARLGAWDFSTPTGIPEGYDAADVDGVPAEPSAEEIDSSVAATIYAVWRSRIIANTIDRALDDIEKELGGIDEEIDEPKLPRPQYRREIMSALRNLFDNFDENEGVGASGINFFPEPDDVDDPKVRRDITVLQSLADALDLLAGDEFASAFGGSTDQQDYRWGRLHRLELDHPLGSPFSIPPAGGAFPPTLPEELLGIPIDGGFETVDAATHDLRGAGSDGFMFESGPTRRHVGQVRSPLRGISGQTSLPGGESGVLGSPLYANLLPRWLTNETHPLRQRLPELLRSVAEVTLLLPARQEEDDD